MQTDVTTIFYDTCMTSRSISSEQFKYKRWIDYKGRCIYVQAHWLSIIYFPFLINCLPRSQKIETSFARGTKKYSCALRKAVFSTICSEMFTRLFIYEDETVKKHNYKVFYTLKNVSLRPSVHHIIALHFFANKHFSNNRMIGFFHSYTTQKNWFITKVSITFGCIGIVYVYQRRYLPVTIIITIIN